MGMKALLMALPVKVLDIIRGLFFLQQDKGIFL